MTHMITALACYDVYSAPRNLAESPLVVIVCVAKDVVRRGC